MFAESWERGVLVKSKTYKTQVLFLHLAQLVKYYWK